MGATEVTHVLVVSEPEEGVREYDIEHDPSCPSEEEFFSSDFDQKHEPMTYLVYKCGVGDLVSHSGIEHAVADIANLVPGRYQVELVTSHTPSTVNGPAEWDAWIEVVNDS